MPRQRRATSPPLLRESSLPRLCTNTSSLLRRSRSINALADECSSSSSRFYRLKESQSLFSLCSLPSSLSLSPSSPSSTTPEPPTSSRHQTQLHLQLNQQPHSHYSKRFSFIHSVLPSPNFARILQSMQSLSPTSSRPSTPKISPRSPTHSRPYLSPISPLSSPLTRLETGASLASLSKHHFEWCVACCRTALDREGRKEAQVYKYRIVEEEEPF